MNRNLSPLSSDQFTFTMGTHSMEISTKRLMPLFALLCALMTVLCSALPAQAVLKTTAASGDWNDGTKWSPAGVPVSGTDWVDVTFNMSVNANTSFGDSSGTNISTMSGGNPIFTVNGANVLNHVAGSKLNITSSQPYLAGTGTIQNSGTINNYSNRFLYLNSSTTFSNQGTFAFRGAASTVDFYDLGSPKFINYGNVNINMDDATKIARFYAEQAALGNGQFVQEGNAIQWTQGILAFAPPTIGGTGIGSSITDANFPLLFDTTSLNGGSGQLRLGGGVNVTLNSGVTNLSNVYIGEASAPLYGTPAGTTINVTGAGIRTSPSAGGQFDTKSLGYSIVNQGTMVVANNGGQFWINGNGKFVNEGTVVVENNRFLLGVSGNTVIENKGTVRFTQNNSRLDLWTGSPVVNNLPGGQIIIDLPNATDYARIGSEGQTVDGGFFGEYHNLGGSPITFVKGTLAFATPAGIGGVLNDAAFANLFGPINNNSFLNLAGGLSNIVLTGATDVSRVRLGDSGQALYVTPSNTVVNVTSPGGIKTANGVAVINIPTGRTLTNLGTIVGTSGQQVYFYGDGSFENQGTLKVENNRFLLGVGGNPVLNNSGTILFTENNSRIDLFANSAANAFNNLANGTVRVNLVNGTDSSEIGRESGSNGTFTNLGTIEVLKGELVVESLIANTTAVTGGGTTLATGNWRVLANGARSKLNLQVGSTGIGGAPAFDGTITSIAAGAGLVLSNQGGGTVELPQLGALQTVAGELYVHGTMNLPVAAAMNVTGTLGGDGTVTTVGAITLNGGVLDPSSLAGGAGSLIINGNLNLTSGTELAYALGTPGIVGGGFNDLVTVFGDLTLDGTLDVTKLANFGPGSYRLFDYTGSLTDNGLAVSSPLYILDLNTFGQVNLTVLPVPEPSTGLLLLAGLVGLRRRKRS